MKFEMKKRILALALAGTTAFSVFGAAVSANAAYTIDSAQAVTNNDQYKHYQPVSTSIAAYYTGANVVTKYVDNTLKTGTTVDGTVFTVGNGTNDKANNAYIDLDGYAYTNYDLKEEYTEVPYTAIQYKDAAGAVVATETLKYAVVNGKVYYAVGAAAASTVEKNTEYDHTGVFGYAYANHVYLTADELINAIVADKTPTGKTASTAEVKDADKAYVHSDKYLQTTPEADYTNKYINGTTYAGLKSRSQVLIGTASTTDTKASGVVQLGWSKPVANPAARATMNGSISADTTIYPWTTTSVYADAKGNVKVDQAVEAPTVYLLDYIPASYSANSAAAIASAYNYSGDAAAAGLITNNNGNKGTFNKVDYVNSAVWTPEKGSGTAYGIRAEVVNDYESFLSDLVLLKSNGYTVSEPAFKAEYKDLYVSGYFYNPYTGNATSAKWTTDLYNIDTLLSDIYNSSVNNAYLQYNTSEMMYLMQQYNKYVGYINKEEVSKDEWGDLLVSILENVAEDDFKKATDYKQFKRKAEDAIDAYNDATTSSLVKAAEQAMYNLVTSTSTRSTGASDEMKALNSDLYSLYFNAAILPNVYTTKSADHGNAALSNYAYLKAVTLGYGSDLVQDKTQMTATTKTGAGYFSLYPQADYKQNGNAVATYVGNKAKYDGTATDEYEWFLNVYELAYNVNKNNTSSSIGGVVSAVDKALTKAVDALNVTVSASNSASTALDETVAGSEKTLDFYVTGNGVNKEDFNATYYNAYTAAVAYADKAEGAAQVANAKAMVAVAADALTYNGTQTTVTKADITTLNASIKNGQAAVKSIKDSANYNAAQVTALNNAIAQAQDIVAIFNGTNGASFNKVNKTSAAYVGDKDCIVKSDITGAISAIDSAINYSNVVMGWSKNDAGKWQYGTKDGYLSNGWNKVGKTWFYFNADGTAKQSEWLQENGKWYYFNSNCGALCGWGKVDGNWYYFKGDNHMKTGWEKVDGNWYYLASSGKMVTGWTQIDGKWYYFSKESNSLGQMLANTTVDGYKLDANGVWNK